ncbi:MAG: MIP/aquaporin family protein [Planctomycetota bacterium]|jgi:aquaporin Z
MKSYLMEFIGTFFLVLAIALSGGAGPLQPIAIGLMLAVMIYAGGHVSGAHYNPAVTVAVLIRGKIEPAHVPGYIIAQVAGSTAAAAIACFVVGKNGFAGPLPAAGASLAQAGVMEGLCTFALALVVLNTATAPKMSGNHIYGLAIGLTVTAGAYISGGISGGCLNPAVYFGPSIFQSIKELDPMITAAAKVTSVEVGAFKHSILYAAGPIAGGVLAAVVYKLTNDSD